jgi:hypothetical protein
MIRGINNVNCSTQVSISAASNSSKKKFRGVCEQHR